MQRYLNLAQTTFANLSAMPPAETNHQTGLLRQENDKVNILVVDDRADKRMAIEAVLARLNQNVVTAKSGKEALRYLLRQNFAVILLDITMPGMDGFETAALIRKRAHSELTPIIFVTSINDTEEHIARGYSLGAVDYILSPIVPEVLRAKVAVFVELYKKTEQVRQQSERLRQMEETEHKKRLAETTSRLEMETRRNRFFLLSIDLLAIAGFDGYFIQMNPAWEKILGYTEKELRAQPFLVFVHQDDRDTTYRELNRLKKGAASAYFENRYQCKDGSYRWLGWTAASFAAERLIYIFARDITSRKTSEEEIKNLNEQLEHKVKSLTEINNELESFNYTISHDLRAPLRAIQGFTSALLEEFGDRLDETGQDYARRIVNGATRMDELIQDLLIYGRLSHVNLPMNSVELETLLERIHGQLEEEIRSKEAEVQWKRPLPAVHGNSTALEQVLTNLITNAMKFIEAGVKPRIRIQAKRRGSLVRVYVEDNGIGIESGYQEKIFRIFERLHGVESYSGTGIGLAIVRKAVERMGGAVGVKSEPGKGSRFWIELKAADGSEDGAPG